MGRGLSPEELATYRGEGLVKPDFRLPADTVVGLRELLTRTLEAAADIRPEAIVCPHIASYNDLGPALAREWLSVCAMPELVDRVASVLGPDIILWGSQLFCKPAGDGLEVPWHQDGEFWPIRPLATATIWLAIDDVDEENSAMCYVPGSQRERKLFGHCDTNNKTTVLDRKIDPTLMDENTARSNNLQAGELSVHDVFLVHGSRPNRSVRRRAGFAIRYMPATSHYDRDLRRNGSNFVDTKFSTRELFLLRGHDWTDKSGLIDIRDGLREQTTHA